MIALSLVLSLLTAAQAAEPSPAQPSAGGPRLGVYAGYAHCVNDPFLQRAGLHGGVELAPSPLFAVGARAGFYPNLGQADWKPLTRQLVEELHIAPDLSRIIGRAEGYVRFTPARREGEQLSSNAGVLVGGGVVRTRDDLEALQAEGDPVALSTERELHPSLVVGLSGELRYRDSFGLRVDASTVRYVETVMGDTLERKRPVFVGLEGTLWLP